MITRISKIGRYSFDAPAGRLTRDGALVPLGGRALAVLTALAGSEGVVPKEALLDAAWPGVTVEDGNLTVQIAALRKLLGEDCIVTVPRIGYRLRRESALSAASLPRIAVLPFDILGGGPEESYFVDGLAEDLIAALGQFRQFAVLSRQAAVAARHGLTEVGVRYVVTGSLRRSGELLRIAAHLTDTTTGNELWSHRLDGTSDDFFAFQDRITEAIAAAVAPEIELAEIAQVRRERSTSFAAYDLYLRAIPLIYGETEEGNAEARRLIDRALEIEPDNPLYIAHAAWVLEHRISVGWPLFDADHRDRCLRYARRALALAQGDARVLLHSAASLVHMREYEQSLVAADRACRQNPNNGMVLIVSAMVHLHAGDLEYVPELIARAAKLSPNDPLRHIQFGLMAHYHIVCGRYGDAIACAHEGLAAQPFFDPLYWILVAALVRLDRMDEARDNLARLRALSPSVTVQSIREGQPRRFPERIEPILDGLARAGLPEA